MDVQVCGLILGSDCEIVFAAGQSGAGRSMTDIAEASASAAQRYPQLGDDVAYPTGSERGAAKASFSTTKVPFSGQNLIDNGEGWQSESELGRAVVKALEDGTCVLGPVAHRDYHGNVVPARGDVEPGAKGSLAYANKLRAERGAKILVENADGTVSEA